MYSRDDVAPLRESILRSADPVKQAPHGDPTLRRIGRGLRRFTGASTSQDVGEQTRLAGQIQLPVTTTRRIAVSSLRGGAGKTTVALLVAMVLNHFRRDRILLVDADPLFGTAALRLGIKGGPSLCDLARSPLASAGFDDVRNYLSTNDSDVYMLRGTAGPTADEGLDLHTYRVGAAIVHRFFAVAVIDCGNGLAGELTNGILADAHANLLISPATEEGAVSTWQALEWLTNHGHAGLVRRTVVVFTAHSPHAKIGHRRAHELIDAGIRRVSVVHLPYDRQLAAGGVVTSDRLAYATRTATMRIAAQVLNAATSV
jgi:MinD-like ATPase involved in chromosome partitioning or flagellar assembly